MRGYSGASYKKFTTAEEAREFTSPVASVIPRQSVKRIHEDTDDSVTADIHRVSQPPPFTRPRLSEPTVIWTDGSCLGNGTSHTRGGVGVYFSPNSSL